MKQKAAGEEGQMDTVEKDGRRGGGGLWLTGQCTGGTLLIVTSHASPDPSSSVGQTVPFNVSGLSLLFLTPPSSFDGSV